MNSIVAQCNCYHIEQDKLHGKGNRVKNITTKSKTEKIYRCTVCEKEQKH